MNDIIKRVWRQDKTVTPDDLNGYIFTSESQAHTFVIEGKNKNTGMPVSINGTVTGEFVNADGVTVPLTGSANGVATLTLTPECYFVPGRFKLTIYVRNGSQNVCIYLGNGHCDKSASDTVAYPSTALPDLTQLMAQFNSRMDNIYSAFPTETVGPADVVTFDDGADDIPVKSLTVQMEPQQDLHGYDYSWVGGDGKNLLNYEDPTIFYKNSNFAFENIENGILVKTLGETGTAYGYVDIFEVTADIVGTSYVLSYSSDKTPSNVPGIYICDSEARTRKSLTSYTIVEDDIGKHLCIYFGTTPAVGDIAYTNIQLEIGTTPTEFEPYSNICPITGYNAVNVTRAGSQESETYTVSLSSAGTVYGGTLTVNGDGTGKVILDSIGHTFNGSEEWTGQWYGTDHPVARLQQPYSPFTPYIGILSTANSNRISSHFRSASVTSTGLGYGVYLHTSGYINIRTACVMNATSSDDIAVIIKAYLTEQAQKGTPLQVVVKILGESNYISFDLNTDQITTLLGGNTIWTDAGQVTVTYRADTEMYINKRLAEQ